MVFAFVVRLIQDGEHRQGEIQLFWAGFSSRHVEVKFFFLDSLVAFLQGSEQAMFLRRGKFVEIGRQECHGKSPLAGFSGHIVRGEDFFCKKEPLRDGNAGRGLSCGNLRNTSSYGILIARGKRGVRMENWLLRTEALIGQEGMASLKTARVMICGLGGVGGMALEVLVRSGVRHFVLVDCDVFHPTNLNRQILATRETLGRPKVEVALQRIYAISPEAEGVALESFIDQDVGKLLDEHPVDFVIDAIDSLNPKVFLISTLWQRRFPFVSAMGAAARFDPSAFRVGKLSEVEGCPLSRKVKQRLRRLDVPVEEIPVVYSTERVSAGQGLLSSPEPNGYERGRIRLPRGSFAPAVMSAGLLVAHVALGTLMRRDLLADRTQRRSPFPK